MIETTYLVEVDSAVSANQPMSSANGPSRMHVSSRGMSVTHPKSLSKKSLVFPVADDPLAAGPPRVIDFSA